MLPLVIQVENLESGSSESYVFLSSPVHIGRNPLNELVLGHRAVSEWHGVLTFEDTSHEFIDLGATNGTQVDGQRIEGNVPFPIGEDSELQLGPFKLKLSRNATVNKSPPREQLTQFRIRLQDLAAQQAALGGNDESQGTLLIGAGSSLPKSLGHGDGSEAHTVMEGSFSAAALDDPEADVFALYSAYRHAWERLYAKIHSSIDSLPPPGRADALKTTLRFVPDVVHEPAIKKLQESLQQGGGGGPPGRVEDSTSLEIPAFVDDARAPAPVARRVTGARPALDPRPAPAPAPPKRPQVSPGNPVADAALSGLRLFATTYASERAGLASPQEVTAFLDRMAQALEAFAKGFVEIRRGQEQFGQEMGLRIGVEDNALTRARKPEDALRYLLTANPTASIAELTRVFADVMIHQVAVLGGFREGTKALLHQLGQLAQPGEGGVLGKLGLGRGGGKVGERIQELLEEESQLHGLVFGPEFARAYTLALGKRLSAVKPAPGKPAAPRASPPAPARPAPNLAKAAAPKPVSGRPAPAKQPPRAETPPKAKLPR